MAKTREQVKKKRRVKRGTMARSTPVRSSAGCDHVRVEPGIDSVVVRGTGYATFAWSQDKGGDTPRFVCSICEASTELPGPTILRAAL